MRKQREKKPDKVQKVINILIAILTLAAIGLMLGWTIYQHSLVNQAVDAIAAGESDTALELIQKVDEIDMYSNQDKTILMAACRYGDSKAIMAALNKGADPNEHLKGTLTPLELYCEFGYNAGEEALLSLLQAGADTKKYEKKPPLYLLTDQFQWMDKDAKKELTDEIILLLQAGSPLKYQGSTILHHLSQHNFDIVVDLLIRTQEGYQMLSETNSDGYTPYDLSVKSGAVQVQRVIRVLQAEIMEATNTPQDPLLAPSTPSQPTTPPETEPIDDVKPDDMSLEEWLALLEEFNNSQKEQVENPEN